METVEIKGGVLEYIDETHTYLYDGIILPSITQLLKVKFGSKYNNIPKKILERAAEQGTAVHQAIEDYEQQNIETDLPELHGYKSLKEEYKFECVGNEVPVVLFRNDEAVACGRLDLVLREGEEIGLGDIKRTSTLDKNYLAYQLNLYRIAYQQCYGTEISFLRGLHLREEKRKYVSLPIDENLVSEILEQYETEKEL
jgi:hypothetical protein